MCFSDEQDTSTTTLFIINKLGKADLLQLLPRAKIEVQVIFLVSIFLGVNFNMLTMMTMVMILIVMMMRAVTPSSSPSSGASRL